jgi:methylglutaconyl-CoA hydratase
MSEQATLVRVERDDRGIATVILNRPEKHNALSTLLIDALAAALADLASDHRVRVLVLTGEGPSFCAGGDIEEMRRSGDATMADNEAEATRLAALLALLERHPKPTVARIQGNAFGGALGLIAACDVAIGAESAVFALSEVRLGIAPAMISPYVVRAIGQRQAHRYFLTGERMSAATAERIGLLHQVVPAERLDATIAEITADLLLGAPGAQGEIKQLLHHIAGRTEATDAELTGQTARWIARLRASAEGREGLSSFLERRAPSWRKR